MKKYLILVVPVFLILPSAAWSMAYGYGSQDGVCMSGQATVNVSPNEATIVMSVESFNEDLNAAFQMNLDSLSKLKSYLAKEKMSSIATDPPIIEPRYAQPNYAATTTATVRTPNGYTIRTTVTGVVKDIFHIRVAAAGALDHGASNLLMVQLRSSDLEKARTEAQQQALEKAKTKVMQMAKDVNQTPGLITSVEETAPQQTWSTYATLSSQPSNNYAPVNLLMANAYGIAGLNEMPIEGGKISVSSTMRVCMEFKDLASREKH